MHHKYSHENYKKKYAQPLQGQRDPVTGRQGERILNKHKITKHELEEYMNCAERGTGWDGTQSKQQEKEKTHTEETWC